MNYLRSSRSNYGLTSLLRLIAAMFLLSIAHPAHAELRFARVTCIPEVGYLRVEYVHVEGFEAMSGIGINSDLINEAQREKMKAERMKLWKTYGYHDLSDLSYECKLPGGTYVLKTNKASQKMWSAAGNRR